MNVNPLSPHAPGAPARTRRGAETQAEPTDKAVLSDRLPPEDHVFELTDATFDDFLKNAKTPVFIEFFNPT